MYSLCVSGCISLSLKETKMCCMWLKLFALFCIYENANWFLPLPQKVAPHNALEDIELDRDTRDMFLTNIQWPLNCACQQLESGETTADVSASKYTKVKIQFSILECHLLHIYIYIYPWFDSGLAAVCNWCKGQPIVRTAVVLTSVCGQDGSERKVDISRRTVTWWVSSVNSNKPCSCLFSVSSCPSPEATRENRSAVVLQYRQRWEFRVTAGEV